MCSLKLTSTIYIVENRSGNEILVDICSSIVSLGGLSIIHSVPATSCYLLASAFHLPALPINTTTANKAKPKSQAGQKSTSNPEKDLRDAVVTYFYT